ncbi:putative ATP-dependent endonuclease of the OLD family [Vibrio crassostreae]|uniref:ATP-dependent nuclease n=1 Tax=Vibrio crassostreae TaxID=246167 RepID=UPI001B3160C0|nr:AAA family ATPase [Vibrio crassostreae]CAK1934041.1 putative ATP-dependent endonuclease of the OLD family [Vibrio crassostreae]CAK1937488.1 putative ATP-dependent endonuclease of the OLD family [Vibrio crassostreae]CAK1951767.1 putative ATP-dependent endonuclease of the OLD family [Vibrio crassostreae]CAK1952871.1 putative ATP-dependent endonuclease of the OLD family [Vibrio crassostreae]CAK1959377.1 putative ATP-dependent endonuclease of the OLD family [Vibrio crassostreae]
MLLNKLVISGYKSVSVEEPQTISLEKDVTLFIGHNGTGKSTVLEALNKLFAVDQSLRGLSPSDFHLPDAVAPETPRDLFIEAWFSISNAENHFTIPPLLAGLTASSEDGSIIFRVRLEASLSFDYNPLGDVEESIWVVNGDMESPSEDDKVRLLSAQRNAIQVNYVPANRDPLSQLRFSSKAILGRLLKAIKWTDEEKGHFEDKAHQLNELVTENSALMQIKQAINQSWCDIYKGQHLKEAVLNFPVGDIDEILKLLQLQFMPDATKNKVDTSRLSDGQKSLVYFALTKALFDLDTATRKALKDGVTSHFDPEKLKLPIFSLMILEEPENHLSPHYLGRVINLVKAYGSGDLCQSIVSTHSASLVGRIEPRQIRHFRLDNEKGSTRVQALTMPADEDEQAKYVSEAIKAYPEIYFSKLVVLGEGDSEQVILPKLLEHFGQYADGSSISIVPLGGRHVNHFWRLLGALKIPYVTLLDFDIDRNGGGFGRIKYAIEQLVNNEKTSEFLHKNLIPYIPEWDSEKNPVSYMQSYECGAKVSLVEELEKKNVFFSSPLDIDYSMICAFPEIFCIPDTAYGERGPVEGKEDEEESEQKIREEALIKAVLKKGNSGKRFEFGDDWERNFLWYRYRFLSNKSKPASHVRMFSKLEDGYTSEQIKERIPPELKRLIERVIECSKQVVE